MRIALAQLNPTSGDIEGNTARIIAALEAAAARGADLFLTPEMALPGYCIGDLVEDAGFLAANERAMQRVAAAARGITAVVGFIDFDPAARNESGGIRQVQRRGGRPRRRTSCSARTRRCCRATAISTTSGSSRQAERREPGRPCRSRTAGRCGSASRSARTSGTSIYDVKPLRGARGQGRGRPAQHQRVAVLSRASATSATQLIRQHIAPARQADRLRQHDRRRGQRQEHHPVRRREPRLRRARAARRDRAASSPRNCSSSISIRAAPSGDGVALPPIDRDREMYDALVMALRDYMRKTGFTTRDRCACRAASTRRWRSRLRSTRSAPTGSRPSTCRRASTPRRPGRSPSGWPRALGVSYTRHPDPGDRRARPRSLRAARPSDRTGLHPREPSCAHPRAADDGGVERHGCAADLLRQRNGDRARLRHALRRHVRRRVAHRRSVQARRLPARPLREHAARRGDRSRKKPFTSSRPPSSRPNQFDPFDYFVVAPIVGELVERRRSPAELVALFERRELDRVAVRSRSRRPNASTTSTPPRPSATSSTTRSGGCGARSTSGCRGRRLSSSPSARSASTCARRSSTGGKADAVGRPQGGGPRSAGSSYGDVQAARGVSFEIAGRRDLRPARPERLGQDHDARVHHRAARAGRRRDRGLRHRRAAAPAGTSSRRSARRCRPRRCRTRSRRARR